MAPHNVKYFECSLRDLIVQSRCQTLHFSIRGNELGFLAHLPLSPRVLASS